MQYNNIIYNVTDQVATITLNRPPYNVINIATMDEINSALVEIENSSDAHFVVFRGAGDKMFSAGVDVLDHTEDKVEEMLSKFHDIFRLLYRWDKISISVVHAPAIGGGCELATFCDFVIAAESTYISQPEIDVGCYPPIAAAAFPRVAGPKIAMDMVLTGRKLSAKEAQAFGLITRVVPDDKLEESLTELLATLEGKSRSVLSLAKKAVRAGTEWEFNLALTKAEDIYIDELLKTEDVKEGLNAFSEKRKPDWRHK
ncbi:MAG: enoyl-CoA hydratase/isomerase family protein [Candidatus Marinimicrobia bacterium]|nr:enoyl-CoA hydratase/isomerase family protein [Candidatus Neomarinimicrobiota bacterium]MCH7955556.1 enoyl-CoA hydratase/isomerase family protein [Candidatus Neomarinimicrobiota bacterium]